VFFEREFAILPFKSSTSYGHSRRPGILGDNTGGQTLTVTNSADALLQTADADAIQMNKPNSSISFDNYGSVISLNASAGGAQAIDRNAITTGSNTPHNYPTGFLEAFEADAIRPGVNGSVINKATIKAVATASPCPKFRNIF
jgi:hypothetical protein